MFQFSKMTIQVMLEADMPTGCNDLLFKKLPVFALAEEEAVGAPSLNICFVSCR